MTPEARAGLWQRLADMAGGIRDDETRAQYLATWRARFDREINAQGEVASPLPALHAQIAADDGDYTWPEDVGGSERRLVMIVRAALDYRRQRQQITERLSDLMAMAKAAGFSPKAIGAVVRDIEADTAVREDDEMAHALYRRVLGVKGPMTEAMMPSPAEARAPRAVKAAERRLARAMVLIDARTSDRGDGVARISHG